MFNMKQIYIIEINKYDAESKQFFCLQTNPPQQ
jgi:hypothetical protein